MITQRRSPLPESKKAPGKQKQGKARQKQATASHSSHTHGMSDTAPEDEDARSATERIAEDVLERLQESGERDRLKQMLLDDLHTHGWAANLFREAALATAAHQAKTAAAVAANSNAAASGGGAGAGAAGLAKVPAPLTADRLADRLTKVGHETMPEEVRNRVLHRLLYVVRAHFKEEGYTPDSNDS